ncbi:MAG TPA: hypothetical protein VEA38_16060 [Terriglobales bacterium]|nr:hypothetical protein [Terriglobales bacterium]
MTILLALLGFAPTADQQRIPPVLAYLLLGAAAYGVGYVLDIVAWLVGPTLSPYLRIPGVLAVALVAHSIYRLVVHRDGLSWGGWLRERLK